MGLSLGRMPTVFARDGCRVLVLLPPREHRPAHVHVAKNDAELLVTLPLKGATLSIRENRGMSRSDVRQAFAMVADRVTECCLMWEKHHGQD
jgi:hypothetical protein